MIDVLEFMKNNNLNDHRFFSLNFDHLMAMSNVCSLFKVCKINNLTMDSTHINFNINMDKSDSSSIPILESSGYGNRYIVNSNIINNTIDIKMEVSTEK